MSHAFAPSLPPSRLRLARLLLLLLYYGGQVLLLLITGLLVAAIHY